MCRTRRSCAGVRLGVCRLQSFFRADFCQPDRSKVQWVAASDDASAKRGSLRSFLESISMVHQGVSAQGRINVATNTARHIFLLIFGHFFSTILDMPEIVFALIFRGVERCADSRMKTRDSQIEFSSTTVFVLFRIALNFVFPESFQRTVARRGQNRIRFVVVSAC